MLNFCTLFDSNYLLQGIAMYESLKKYCDDFHLYIFAFDDKSCSILKKLNLPRATVISLNEFEDKELLEVKPFRSKGEYCWTCTPSVILYAIRKYKLKTCTYLDADLYFFASPGVLLNELNGDSIIITEHRYTPGYDSSITSGKYCVQFVTFRNDERGLKALKWWRLRCLEWCYARVEAGKFGDQKYLDDWTTRFKGVHVLAHLGGGVAPWNIQQYEIFKKNNRFFAVEKSSRKLFQIIFYHFFSLKFFQKGIIQLTSSCLLRKKEINLLYKPYIKHLGDIRNKLKKVDKSIAFSYPVSPQKPLTMIRIIGWFIEDVRVEITRLIRATLFIKTIKRIHSYNIYFKDRLLKRN